MKKVFIIGLFWLIAGFEIRAQEAYEVRVLSIFQSKLEKQLLTEFEDQPFLLLQSLNTGTVIYHDNWESLTKHLDQLAKRKQTNVQLLSDIFFHTHNRILEKYTTFASFATTLRTGAYDCVTGTAVMGLLLDRYGMDYKIIELQGHVYLKGMIDNQPFIIESTDPSHGLLIGKRRVESFERKIIATQEARNSNDNERIGQRTRFQKQLKVAEISLKELAGLQYYNDAVRKFDEGTFEEAYVQLIKGELLYPSSRIIQFKQQLELLLTQ